jgi:hypothetical protein
VLNGYTQTAVEQRQMFRITITVDPADGPDERALLWMLELLGYVHNRPPGPVQVKVEEPPLVAAVA